MKRGKRIVLEGVDEKRVICGRHPTLLGRVYQWQEYSLRLIEAVHQTAPIAKHDRLLVPDTPAVAPKTRTWSTGRCSETRGRWPRSRG